jgi:hypothetical protein
MTQLAVPFLYLPGGTDKSHDNPSQLSRCPIEERLEPTSSHYEAADNDANSCKVSLAVMFQVPPTSDF